MSRFRIGYHRKKIKIKINLIVNKGNRRSVVVVVVVPDYSEIKLNPNPT